MPSLTSSIVALAFVGGAFAHVSLINIYGSNNRIGHAFGVNLYGKYPRIKGAPGDAGGDSGIFQTGTDTPNPPCGRTPELGNIDVSSWLSQAEGDGLPSAHPNMSVVAEAFQVNRDGGGPMSCEYNEDATATSWKPMIMILNQAGNFGIQNQVRTNETVVMNFPPTAVCKGGFTGSACIVRCRTGVNKRFGGCFAVQLSGAKPFAQTVVDPASVAIAASTVQRIANVGAGVALKKISQQDLDLLAKGIVASMKKQGLVMSASAIGSTCGKVGPNSPKNPSKKPKVKSSSVIKPKSISDSRPIIKNTNNLPTLTGDDVNDGINTSPSSNSPPSHALDYYYRRSVRLTN